MQFTTLALPTGLFAAAASTSQINLSWTADTAAGLTGFILESSSDRTTFTALETLSPTATSASDVKLATGTEVYYELDRRQRRRQFRPEQHCSCHDQLATGSSEFDLAAVFNPPA